MSEPSREHLKVLQDLAFLNLSSRRFTETEDLVNAGLSETRTLQDKETEIRLRSYRAWIYGASGELQQARDVYSLLIKEANESKLTSLLALAIANAGTNRRQRVGLPDDLVCVLVSAFFN